jgi:hypothetical protein
MEAPLTIRISEAAPPPPRDEEAIELVRSRFGLSPEAAIAWEAFMASDLVRWRYEFIRCNSQDLAATVGGHEAKSRRALKAWAAKRLVEPYRGRLDAAGRGPLLRLMIRDPRTVPCPDRGELAAVAGDPQRQLTFDAAEPPDPSAPRAQREPGGEAPRAGALSETTQERNQVQEHSTIEQLGSVESVEPPARANRPRPLSREEDRILREIDAKVRRAQEQADEQYHVQPAMVAYTEAIVDFTNKTATPVARKRLLAEIRDVVRDPTMSDVIARKVADAVVLYDAPIRKFKEILEIVERTRAKGFREEHGAAKLFRKLGMDWYEKLGLAWKKPQAQQGEQHDPKSH